MNINRNTSHASAFISSTFLDLTEERKAVAKVLREANLNINALDIKPASNNKSKEEIFNGIKESDFIILIVGQRYGSIIPEMTQSTKLSITRWEYNQSRLNKKYVLVFFKEPNNNGSANYEAEPNNKVKLLEEFKNLLSKNHNPKYFSTISELEEEVKKALIPTYRSGVMSLLSKIEQLKSENARLRQDAEKQNFAHAKDLPKQPVASSSIPIGTLGLSSTKPSTPRRILAGLSDANISKWPIRLADTRK